MRVIRLVATLVLLLAAPFVATPAWAQLRIEPPSEAVAVGQNLNVFAEWTGEDAVSGFRLSTDLGWIVQAGQAVRDGSAAATSLRVHDRGDGTFDLLASASLRGTYTLVFGLTVGDEIGYHDLSVRPLHGDQPGDGQRSEWVAYVNERAESRENQAFRLPAEAAPVALRRAKLPPLGMRDPYTVEFWVQTVGLNEVVLSTWDGDEERPYPLEVVVDARGRLVFYRGRPGHHESMHTPSPIADGHWHHIALTNDPYAERARLFLDGHPVDSLRVEDMAGTLNTMSLVLGGRPDQSDGTRSRSFSGSLDELRIWNGVRPPAMLRSTMRVPLDAMPDGSFRLGFETSIPEEVLVRPIETSVRVPSDLSFAFPVEALEASTEGGIVTLSWETKDQQTETFQIERSADGQRFEEVGTVAAKDHIGEGADGALRFVHTDLPPPGQVLYYRVRQLAQDAPERVSGALKLGLGPTDAPAVAIVGNSPNPFRDRTVLTYDLARTQPVTLSMWDVSGTRVAVLFDETRPAGRHEYTLSANGMPSGVYFVRLETPDGTAVHKMALTR